MPRFSILTTRKRAIIALAHTFIFLAVAMAQVAVSRPVSGFVLHGHNRPVVWMMVTIYTVVTSVLLALLGVSRSRLERLYFGCCASSASFGLLRSVIGDPPLHVAQYVRVAMLVCAVVVGTVILRMHSEVLVAE